MAKRSYLGSAPTIQIPAGKWQDLRLLNISLTDYPDSGVAVAGGFGPGADPAKLASKVADSNLAILWATPGIA